MIVAPNWLGPARDTTLVGHAGCPYLISGFAHHPRRLLRLLCFFRELARFLIVSLTFISSLIFSLLLCSFGVQRLFLILVNAWVSAMPVNSRLKYNMRHAFGKKRCSLNHKWTSLQDVASPTVLVEVDVQQST